MHYLYGSGGSDFKKKSRRAPVHAYKHQVASSFEINQKLFMLLFLFFFFFLPTQVTIFAGKSVKHVGMAKHLGHHNGHRDPATKSRY